MAAILFGAGLTLAQSAAQTVAQPSAQPSSTPMTWLDLRGNASRGDANGPFQGAVAAQTALWQDKLSASQQRWRKNDSRPFPAFVLTQKLETGSSLVVVSILFNMFDCDLPGNGGLADLYARCPMRVVISSGAAQPGAAGLPNIRQYDDVCTLYVPPVASLADGPDPRRNFTAATIGPDRVVHLRTTQNGRAVRACDLDIALGAP
jgi:hypothetical protein